MRQPDTRALALRVGHGAIDPAERGAEPPACRAELPSAGLPWDLDALLALAEPAGPDPLPADTRFRLEAAFRGSPAAGADMQDPDALVSELVAAHRRIVGEAPVRLTLACIRNGRFWTAQAPGLPLYLLRDATFLPVEPDFRRRREAGEEQEFELAAGRLRDGDALVLCSAGIHAALSEWDVREIIIGATSPASAARKLAAEARSRGAASAEAVLLFAGVGPAVAHRLHSAAPPAPGPPARSRIGLAAGAAGFSGALLGLAIGAAIVLNVPRPPPEPAGDPAAPAQFADLTPIVAVPAPPTTTPAGPPLEAPAPRTVTPLQSSTPEPSPAPVPQPAPVRAALPAALSAQPPRHPIGPGLGQGIHLTFQLDAARGLSLRASQGALYSPETPQGVPAGEPLGVSATLFQRDRPPASGELRLCAAGGAVTAIEGERLKRLLAGEAVDVPEVRAGDYTLCWAAAPDASPTPPFLYLRVSGL